MGKVGTSFASLFPFATSIGSVVTFLNTFDPTSNIAVLTENDKWAVATGDQLLFEGSSEAECADFLYGLVVGGTIFPDLAQNAR